ncbi:hypothetical protein JST97_03420 [bacterium]|nr:hypothetical protein [bacterium]
MSYHNGEKRSQVVRLLEGGTRQKLMRGEVPRAFEPIREAYSLATTPPRLESPWPEVCAYRLAHVLLRHKTVDCERIQQLFEEASRLEALGPWPALYRMALLQFLGRKEELPALWQQAFARRSSGSTSPDSTSAGLRSNEVMALELMACASGNFSSLPQLNGLGLPLDVEDHPIWTHLFGGEDCAWRMYGPSPHLMQIAYPHSAARAELESIRAARPQGFFFILSLERPAQFWYQDRWLGFPKIGLLELLVAALRIRKYDNASLAEALDVSDGALRVRKVELHNLLRAQFPTIGEVPPYYLDIFGIVQHGAG